MDPSLPCSDPALDPGALAGTHRMRSCCNGRSAEAGEGVPRGPGGGTPGQGASLPQEAQSALSPAFSDRPLPVPGLRGQRTFPVRNLHLGGK